MKRILLNLLFACIGLALTAQTPNYKIVVSQPANDDTLLMDLLGVISGPTSPPHSPLPDITSQMQDIGVTSIRNNGYYDDKLDMESLFRCFSPRHDTVPCWNCDPTDPKNFHFEASDTLYRAIREGGFKLFFRLGGEIQSDLPNQHHVFHGPQDTVAENNWIRATVPVVEHYDNFEGGTNQLDYLDIWTEWPNPDFWERPNSEFIWFFTKALDTLKTHFPDKKIGGPGFLVPTQKVISGIVNNKATDLLTSLYQHRLKPDFISWHLWSLNPERYYLAGENFRKLLNGEKPFQKVPWAKTGFFNGVEIICGAWGTPQMSDEDLTPLSEKEKYLLYNKQKGAALLTADWIAMQETNTVKAFYYRDADPVSDPDTTLGDAGGPGIFYGNAQVSYKPKAYAFKLWSKIYQEFPQKLSCDFPVKAADSSKLYVLAAKNNQNAYGLLVANTDSIDKTFDITINGTSLTPADYDIYYYLVNDDNNGEVQLNNSSTHFSIPLQTVEFIRILPKNYTFVKFSKTAANLKIFPNPTTGTITVSVATGYKVTLFNISGKRLLTIPETTQKVLTLDLSPYGKGFFLIKLENQKTNTIHYQKIIVN